MAAPIARAPPGRRELGELVPLRRTRTARTATPGPLPPGAARLPPPAASLPESATARTVPAPSSSTTSLQGNLALSATGEATLHELGPGETCAHPDATTRRRSRQGQ